MDCLTSLTRHMSCTDSGLEPLLSLAFCAHHSIEVLPLLLIDIKPANFSCVLQASSRMAFRSRLSGTYGWFPWLMSTVFGESSALLLGVATDPARRPVQIQLINCL